MEDGVWKRAQEVTWTGDHVRFVCSFERDRFHAKSVDVSPDGSFIAVCASHVRGAIRLLDGRTCAPGTWVGAPRPNWMPCNVRFSPDGDRVTATASNHRPTMFRVNGNGAGNANGNGNSTEFGRGDR